MEHFLKANQTANLLFFLLTVTAAIILCKGCHHDRLNVDVSQISHSIKISRFENDLFVNFQDSIGEKIPELKNKYGKFFDLFCTRIINIGPAGNPSSAISLKNFIADYDIRNVFSDSRTTFKDISMFTSDVTNGFKRYHFYFPRRTVPDIITYISGFNYAVITSDSLIGIGLDMYLGSDYRYYQMMGFPEYKRHNMNPSSMAVDCMRGWLLSEYAPDERKHELIYSMVYYGKILFCLNACFPEASDTIIAGYSKQQAEWCTKNEKSIWAFFIDKKLLFATDLAENNKYIEEGPFTAGMPRESPGSIGRWIGWRIVQSYMNENSDVTLDKLILEQDANKILTLSNYKPKK